MRTIPPGQSAAILGAVIALTAAFTAQKLTAAIAWSWVWVLSPAWICALALVLVIGAVFVAAFRKAWKEPRT